MDIRQLRRHCEARLKPLILPVPFAVRAFCAAVAHQRERPILVVAAVFPRGQYGLTVRRRDADVIFYEQETSTLHQEHIILHELCHLLCGHTLPDVADLDRSHELFPLLSAAAMEHMLQRNGYSTEEEREVEVLASLILERAGRATVPPPDAAEPTLARLGAVLEAGAHERP